MLLGRIEERAPGRDAGVRAHDIEPPVRRHGGFDHSPAVGGRCEVTLHRERLAAGLLDRLDRGRGTLLVPMEPDDDTRPQRAEGFADRPPDAGAAASDGDDASLRVHARSSAAGASRAVVIGSSGRDAAVGAPRSSETRLAASMTAGASATASSAERLNAGADTLMAPTTLPWWSNTGAPMQRTPESFSSSSMAKPATRTPSELGVQRRQVGDRLRRASHEGTGRQQAGALRSRKMGQDALPDRRAVQQQPHADQRVDAVRPAGLQLVDIDGFVADEHPEVDRLQRDRLELEQRRPCAASDVHPRQHPAGQAEDRRTGVIEPGIVLARVAQGDEGPQQAIRGRLGEPRRERDRTERHAALGVSEDLEDREGALHGGDRRDAGRWLVGVARGSTPWFSCAFHLVKHHFTR